MNKKTAYIIPGNRVTAFLLFLAIFSVSLTAKDADMPEEDATIDIEYHSMGDQIFSINAGLFFPLFFQNPSPGSGEDAISSTNLSLGGTGHLYYGAYLNNNVILGMEIGAMFARSPNRNNFYMVPIMFRGTYEFQFKNNLFTVPVHLGAGISMTSYLDDFHVDMILNPVRDFSGTRAATGLSEPTDLLVGSSDLSLRSGLQQTGEFHGYESFCGLSLLRGKYEINPKHFITYSHNPDRMFRKRNFQEP